MDIRRLRILGEPANVPAHSVEDKTALALLRANGQAAVIWVLAHLRNWVIRELRQDDAVDSDQAAHCNTPLTIHRGERRSQHNLPYLYGFKAISGWLMQLRRNISCPLVCVIFR